MNTPPWKMKPEEVATQQDVVQPSSTTAPEECADTNPYAQPYDPKTGRFLKGSRGRPKGTRNRSTVFAETMMHGESKEIIRKCIELALQGDPTAMRLAMERIYPVPKGRALQGFKRREGENSIEALLRAVFEGDITPEEGKEVVNLIESASRVAAIKVLTDMREQQFEALKKAGATGAFPGGIMFVPLSSDKDEWETLAVERQHLLKQKVKE